MEKAKNMLSIWTFVNVKESFYLHTYTVTYINNLKAGSFSVHMTQVAHQAGAYLRFLKYEATRSFSTLSFILMGVC